MFDESSRRATRVIANSQATKKAICQYMHVPPERVDVVLEAVDDSFGMVGDVQAKTAEVRQRYNLRRDYILFVSTLWRYKNANGALRAFGRLRACYGDDLDLVIAGPDGHNLLPELRAQAQAQGEPERVHFLGKVDTSDLTLLYLAARVLIYPSLAETFGKPVIEAMRSRVPVVAAHATCLPEIVESAGLLVDPRDDDAMAAALHQAATDVELRQTLIERGLHRARDFSWSATAMGTLAVCLAAVNSRKAG